RQPPPGLQVKIVSKIRNITPTVVGGASLVSRTLGHRYQKGKMHAKHIVALAIGSIFRCSDAELPEELDDRRLLKVFGYKSCPDSSIYSKVRKEVGEEKIGKVAELIIQSIYRARFVSIVAIDSTFLPYYFDDDHDAAFGYITLKKNEQEILKERTQKGIKRGYKLHVIYDVDTGIPLYWIVLPANVHDKDAFKTLFDYVRTHFKFAHNAKFLADSAYDSKDVRFMLRENRLIPLIAVNGRGHYRSSKPRDKDYRKRGAIERFFSLMKMKLNLLNVRVKGIQKVTAHANSCIFGYLLKYIL
ncbi:MAG: transposase, partial [Rhabdochlamydiaceae bacterium]